MKKSTVAALALLGLSLAGCGKKSVEEDQPVAAEPSCSPTAVAEVQTVEITPGLTSRTLIDGCGAIAEPGQLVIVHYTGWLFNAEAELNRGNKFDSSHDRNDHFRFPLGAGRVIKGWDQGVAGMAIGEVRELTIAPELAYGDRDISVIPPGSTLVFEVELAGLENPAATGSTQAEPSSAKTD